MSLPTVDIKGNQYTLVKDRIIHFNKEYEKGAIKTELLSETNAQRIVVKATVYPDADNLNRYFTGHAQEVISDGFINKSSALENAETSAVGRAFAMMGIGVVDSIASVDEINKAKVNEKSKDVNRPTHEQKKLIADLCGKLDIPLTADDSEHFQSLAIEILGIPYPLNREQAEQIITVLEDKVNGN